VSPRANLAVDVSRGTTLFLNGGGGFHSNDARDVIMSGGETVLPRAWGGEVGARAGRETWGVGASLWALALESELVYVGDEGVTEPSGRTRRHGVDLEARLRLLPWLWSDADVNLARGRFLDEPAGEDRIPLAPTITATAGLTVRDAGPVDGGMRFRHIGSRPADESDTVRALGYTVWETTARYTRGRAEVVLAVENLFDVHWNEAQFATTSRLHHEPEEITELHFTPGAPRSVHLGVSYRF
jgi:outer membrane receptor protein involved in Fe transport